MATNSTNFVSKDSTEEKRMECGVCLGRFKDPRLLDCFHTFCSQCLQNYTSKYREENPRSESFPCPVCLVEVHLPDAGVNGLEPNYFISHFHDSHFAMTEQSCDVCTKERSAVTRCLDCEQNFCSACLDFHRKIRSTKTHNLVEKNTDKKSPRHIILKKRRLCCKHEGEELVLHCQLCNLIICRDCKLTEHEGHQTKYIKEIAETKRNELSKLLEKAVKHVPVMEMLLRNVYSIRDEVHMKYLNTQEDIEKQASFLHDEIDRITKTMVEELMEKQNDEIASIQKYENDLESEYKFIIFTIPSVSNMIESCDDILVILMERTLTRRMEKVVKMSPFRDVNIEFAPGEIEYENLRRMIGNVDQEAINLSVVRRLSENPAKVSAKLISMFKCNDKAMNIHAIAPISDNEAWVCCGWGSSKIELFDRHGKNKKTVNLDIQVDDMCVGLNGDVFISSYNGTSIKRMRPDMEVEEFINIPMVPRGLAFTDDHGLLVCAVDSFYATQSMGRRHILLKISEDGEIEEEISNEGHDPYRVSQNINGDICYSDYGNKRSRQVVVLNSDRKIKVLYQGPRQTINDKCSFYPLGICCDKHGHIIVADWNNDAIHLLSSSGRFLKFLLTERDGIENPSALATDKAGYLWVGDVSANIRIYKYFDIDEDDDDSDSDRQTNSDSNESDSDSDNSADTVV